jgi:hypothetical protein
MISYEEDKPVLRATVPHNDEIYFDVSLSFEILMTFKGTILLMNSLTLFML